MELLEISDYETFQEFKSFTEENKLQVVDLSSDRLETLHDLEFSLSNQERFVFKFRSLGEERKKEIVGWLKEKSYNPLIFGRNRQENIVSCEPQDEFVELFIERDGVVRSEIIPSKYWILAPSRLDNEFTKLNGKLYYNYIKYYNTRNSWYSDISKYNKKDVFVIWDQKEAAMLLNGFTYFKGMKIEDISILSFDIESAGLSLNQNSKVFLIANTLRKNGVLTRKMFSIDEYESDKEMFEDWCDWVREVNPSIILGHNIYGYDFPYLNFCANKAGASLCLGRDDSELKISKKESKFRVDGSKEIFYKRSIIFGREIVDTMQLAYHYDVGRKYDSYGLKQIIKQEDLEIEGRQFYDASKIKDNWHNEEERKKIKNYARMDGDDALALFNLMAPSYFYLNQSVPKSFQAINYSASGSQINSFLIRSYLQDGHSIPKCSEVVHFEGAISFGVPGIYCNVMKIDYSALYPSLIRQFKIYDKYKDPNAYFLQMVEYFTLERLKNKKLSEKTGNKYYKDLSESQKIFCNSSYGLLGAPGLNFNNSYKAAFITQKGRELLKMSIKWATGKEYEYWKQLFDEKTK